MARIRSIHPGFWLDSKIVQLSHGERLLFIGIWTFADDAGRIENNTMQLKLSIFPGDLISVETIQAACEHLLELGLLHPYQVDGKEYYHCPRWHAYQSPKKPTVRFPTPPCCHPKESPTPSQYRTSTVPVRYQYGTSTVPVPDGKGIGKGIGKGNGEGKGVGGERGGRKTNSRKKAEWESPEWFKPLTTLKGYKKRDHGRSAEVIAVTCAEVGIPVAEVAAAFAEYYRLNHLRNGWSDPVKALRSTIALQVKIALQKKGGQDGESRKTARYAAIAGQLAQGRSGPLDPPEGGGGASA